VSEDERRYQTDILKNAIFDCVDKHVEQYQITFAEAVGVLECCKFQLIVEMRCENDGL
jgi:hypothetical protein